MDLGIIWIFGWKKKKTVKFHGKVSNLSFAGNFLKFVNLFDTFRRESFSTKFLERVVKFLSFFLSFFLEKGSRFFFLEIIHRHRKNDIVPVKITGWISSTSLAETIWELNGQTETRDVRSVARY